MSGLILPKSELLELFKDNTTRDITPFRERCFILSAFGWSSLVDPTPDNDRVDTAGIGQKFGPGIFWRNTVSGDVFCCFAAEPGIAVWIGLNTVAAVTVLGTSPVDVTEAPAGTFTVSLPSYPASDLSAGTVPAGVLVPATQISAGTVPAGVLVPATQLSAGAVPAGVTLPATQLSAGAVPAGVTVPYGQVTGAPSPGAGNTLKHNTYTVTTGYATAVTMADSNGLHGQIKLHNNTGVQLQYRWKWTAVAGSTGTTANTNIFAGQKHSWNLETGQGTVNAGEQGPYSQVELEVSGLGTAGNNLEIYMSVVGSYTITP